MSLLAYKASLEKYCDAVVVSHQPLNDIIEYLRLSNGPESIELFQTYHVPYLGAVLTSPCYENPQHFDRRVAKIALSPNILNQYTTKIYLSCTRK